MVDGDKEHEVLTFGPLAVEPTCFSMGIGSLFLKETLTLAKEAGYKGHSDLWRAGILSEARICDL